MTAEYGSCDTPPLLGRLEELACAEKAVAFGDRFSQRFDQGCFAASTFSVNHDHRLAQGSIFVEKDICVVLDQRQSFAAPPKQPAVTV
jgi:hypothetical protein